MAQPFSSSWARSPSSRYTECGPPPWNWTRMSRPIEGDGTSRDSTGSPLREYAAAVGVSTATMARTGSSAPSSTAKLLLSHSFTIGKLAVRRRCSPHGARGLTRLLSKVGVSSRSAWRRHFERDTGRRGCLDREDRRSVSLIPTCREPYLPTQGQVDALSGEERRRAVQRLRRRASWSTPVRLRRQPRLVGLVRIRARRRRRRSRRDPAAPTGGRG